MIATTTPLLLPDNCRVLGLDIDGTITAFPAEFFAMSQSARNQNIRVVIITSRSEIARKETEQELMELGIYYNKLHFLPSITLAGELCPHRELDWYNRYLWHKVKLAQNERVTYFFDDDEKVQQLFLRYAPDIAFRKV